MSGSQPPPALAEAVTTKLLDAETWESSAPLAESVSELTAIVVEEVALDGSWDTRDNRCHLVDRKGHMIGEPLRDIVAAAVAFKASTTAQRIVRTRDGMVMGQRLSAAKAGDPPKPRFSLKRRKKAQ